jgi:hypothetical protein
MERYAQEEARASKFSARGRNRVPSKAGGMRRGGLCSPLQPSMTDQLLEKRCIMAGRVLA